MAEIILVWNVHPNESAVSKEMSKRLKKELEEPKHGHKVRIVKYPDKLTKEYELEHQNITNGQELVNLLRGSKEHHQTYFNNLSENNPAAFIIDMHTTPDTNYKELSKNSRQKRKIKFWQAREYEHESPDYAPLLGFGRYDHINRERMYYFEIPAKYQRISEKIYRLAQRTLYKFSHPELYRFDHTKLYFQREVNLEATKAANYISPLTVRKAAHALSTKVNTILGIYREPRGKKFRPKAPKPSEKEIKFRKTKKRVRLLWKNLLRHFR